MRKKVLIMRKTRSIMRKIFGLLRSPKITSFHTAEIELPPKPTVCSQANFNKKKLYWYFGLFQLPVFSFVFGMLTTVILLAEVDFLLMHKQYSSRCYVIYYNIAR